MASKATKMSTKTTMEVVVAVVEMYLEVVGRSLSSPLLEC
jgi:hypothetical protein